MGLGDVGDQCQTKAGTRYRTIFWRRYSIEFSNMRFRSSGAIPIPWSTTWIRALHSSERSVNAITRLSPEYFIALLKRLRIGFSDAARSRRIGEPVANIA